MISSFENCIVFKINIIFLIIYFFSEKNYIQKENIYILFSCYHSLALHACSWDILQINEKK